MKNINYHHVNNLTPVNNEGRAHGYWIYHWFSGKLMYIGNSVNGQEIGYWEWCNSLGTLTHKTYFIP